jgi:hypothetical protein
MKKALTDSAGEFGAHEMFVYYMTNPNGED